MAAILVIRRPREPEHRVEMSGSHVTFGRAFENDVASPSDTRLSRQHFVIELVGNRWVVRDLNSRNGTFVNGQRVAVRRLYPGDRITAAGFEVRLELSNTAESDTITTLDAALQSSLISSDRDLAERHIRAFVDAGRVVVASCTPTKEFWESLLAIIVEALGAEYGVIATIESSGEWEAVAGESFDISDSVRARIVRDRVSLLVRDLSLDADLGEAPSLLAHQIHSLVAAPLQTATSVLGLTCIGRRSLPEFGAQELNLLTIIANMTALRLEQVQLAERAERDREQIREMQLRAVAQQEALRAAELMRYAETRAILADTAASMSKLAAAVSHELNTPLGALKNSVDTLLRVVSRAREGVGPGPGSQLAEDLCTAIMNSTSRLSEIIRRLQRFTNLDRADLQTIDLAQFLRDVVASTPPHEGGPLEFDDGLSLTVFSRPQQLATAFSALLERSRGRVHITAQPVDRGIEVRLHAVELIMNEQDLVDLFDPTFRVDSGRVATANWNLFSARQIVRELGGDIQADIDQARGTLFTVLIPNLCSH